MDGTALFTGLLGMVVGAVALYHVMKRDWWAVMGNLAMGAACLLVLVTSGPRSHDERAARVRGHGCPAVQLRGRRHISPAPDSAARRRHPAVLMRLQLGCILRGPDVLDQPRP